VLPASEDSVILRSCFDTILACDGQEQTDRQIDGQKCSRYTAHSITCTNNK